MIAATKVPAVAYLRRSTDRQEQSIPDQRKEVLRWAGQNGYDVIREYVDDAVSGTSADQRPAFQLMVADAKGGEFRAVVVWNSDRFSRADVTETEYYRYLLRKSGVKVLSVTEDYLAREGIDGDVLRTVKQFQNRQFSISLSQNTLRGQVSSVMAASDPGRPCPYGYDREVTGPDGTVLYRVRFCPGGVRDVYHKDGTLQARYLKGQSLSKPGKECRARLVLSEPQRVRVVEDIYRMCLEGVGFKGIADRLNARGIPGPRGRLWSFTTVKAILENPVYRGDIVWNRRTEAKFYMVRQGRVDHMRTSEESAKVVMTSKEDWIVVPDVVPAIVDRRTWEKAQVMVRQRSAAKGGQGKQTNRWLLSGVLRCGDCGQAYWGDVKHKGRAGGRKDVTTRYYTCAGRRTYGKTVCSASSHIRADELEAWVLGKLKTLVFADDACVDAAVERFVQAVMKEHGNGEDVDRLTRQIRQVADTAEAITANIDPANLPLLNERLTQLRRQREALEDQLRVAMAGNRHLDEVELRRWAKDRIKGLAEAMAGRRDEKTRQVLACYVEEVVVKPSDKTGYMALNPTAFALYENARGRPKERSRAYAVAGVGFEPTTSGL